MKHNDLESSIFEDLEATSRGERPPFTGELEFRVSDVPLPSIQSKHSKRRHFNECVRSQLANFKYYLVKDVMLEICWYVHRRSRYETSSSPDLDNTIKLIIDSLCGSDALLIDDCQVMQVCVTWEDVSHLPVLDSYNDLRIVLRYQPDDWLPKQNFCFVKYENLCFPFVSNPECTKLFHISLDNMKEFSKDLTKMGVNDRDASLYFPGPGQHAFHRRRVEGKGFTIV
jgi:Endodeoxyribonuclease RusA